ncbi:MAG: S8 family peptidase [Myxococcota bacterium]
MTLHTAAVAVLLFLGATSDAKAPAPWVFPKDHAPGQLLVKWRLTPTNAVLAAASKRTHLTLSTVRRLHGDWLLVEVRSDVGSALTETETARALTRLTRDPAVAQAQVDRWYRPLVTPNDPAFPSMWHLRILGAEEAWEHTQGTSAQRVGVVDTGTVRAHEELNAKDLTGHDFISVPQVSADGDGRDAEWDDPGDGANCGGGFQPSTFHGTHVAGTILASTDNGVGLSGINWNARLVTARTLGRCGGFLSDVLDGARWLAGANVPGVPDIGENKVSVINLSLGGAGPCGAYEQEVFDDIHARGVIAVAAAGNDGGDVNSPANCNGVVTVAAHGPGASRPLAPYSSFGSTVDIVAPGGAIQTSLEQGVYSSLGPDPTGYGWYQGTSMATPHVAGAISLMLSLNPALTRDDVVALLQQTGVDCGGCQGRKSLQLDAVVAEVGGFVPPEPPQVDAGPPLVDDGYEENDFFENAAPIACGDVLDLVYLREDPDWFQLRVAEDTVVTVTLQAVQPTNNLDLFLASAPGPSGILLSSAGPTGEEQLQFEAPGGALGLGVVSNGGNALYRLTVDCPPQPPVPDAGPPPDASGGVPGDDSLEPNNTILTARPIGCGSMLTLTAAQTDDDWFSVTAPAGTRVTANLNTDPAADLRLRLTDDPERPAALGQSVTNAGSARVSSVAAGGLMAVGVRGSFTATYDYALNVTCQSVVDPGPTDGGVGPQPPADDAQEPNDSLAEARELACGAPQDLVLSDVDFFKIPLREQEVLRVGFSGQADLQVELLSSAGSVLAVGRAGDGDTSVATSPQPAGRAFIRVSAATVTGTAYRLEPTCQASSGGAGSSGTPGDGPDTQTPWGCSSTGTPVGVVLGLALLGLRPRRRKA